jgi:voltage-gated potassium channel
LEEHPLRVLPDFKSRSRMPRMGPHDWYGRPGNLELMFGRPVCASGVNPREELIDHDEPRESDGPGARAGVEGAQRQPHGRGTRRRTSRGAARPQRGPPMSDRDQRPAPESEEERWKVLHDLERWAETPMTVLGFVWLALLVAELTRGLSPLLATAGTVIWVVFVFDFVLRFALAPRKAVFLRRNWLTAISLVVPAIRFARALRALRGLRFLGRVRLVKVVGGLNRGMRALGKSVGRRHFGYVLGLTSLVTLTGAAGMYAFERDVPGGGFDDFGSALWWTAMMITTLGSEHWPRTGEGRALCFLLALYAFSVFGYVTATLATYFVGRDAENTEGEIAGAASIASLQAEIAAMREEIRALGGTRGR